MKWILLSSICICFNVIASDCKVNSKPVPNELEVLSLMKDHFQGSIDLIKYNYTSYRKVHRESLSEVIYVYQHVVKYLDRWRRCFTSKDKKDVPINLQKLSYGRLTKTLLLRHNNAKNLFLTIHPYKGNYMRAFDLIRFDLETSQLIQLKMLTAVKY